MVKIYGINEDYPNPLAPEPSGLEFAEIAPAKLRESRTSTKYHRFADDVLPLFIAEMDFAVDPHIKEAVAKQVEASDFGYLHNTEHLKNAYTGFCSRHLGWSPRPEWTYITGDLGIAIVELLRVATLPAQANIAFFGPIYNGFFEMFKEIPGHTQLEIPLVVGEAGNSDPEITSMQPRATINFELLEAAFNGTFDDQRPGRETVGRKANVFLLSNPHNPHGICWSKAELERIAELAARYQVTVISDEVHSPLTHRGRTFTSFAPLAAAYGVTTIVLNSASKTWNIAGLKCAQMTAVNAAGAELLAALPMLVGSRTCLLGVAANEAAYNADITGSTWRERALERIAANVELLHDFLAAELPEVLATIPDAGYLCWLDLRGTTIAENPAQILVEEGKVAFSDGCTFGDYGAGFVRINLACSPDTLVEALTRLRDTVRRER